MSSADAATLGALLARLRDMGAPAMCARLVALVFLAGLAGSKFTTYDAVEFFSGVESISNAFRGMGLSCYSYDYDHGQKEDVNTDAGFVFGLILCLRIREGGFCWLAPLCSSWVWISSGTTLRSSVFPEGLTGNAACKYGNKMVARIMLYCWICWLRRSRHPTCISPPSSNHAR